MRDSSPSSDRPSGHFIAEVEGVTHDFMLNRRDRIRVLENVSFEVDHGQMLALIGPSGCGKSTLIRMFAGLIEPSQGRVRVSGAPPSVLSKDHRIGIAFQDHALLPWLTTRHNISLPFRLSRKPPDHEHVNYLLELVGLEGFADTRPKQLSGGMRQRASIARALVLRPALLLLDEPMGSLDAVTRRHLTVELQRIWMDQPVTTVLVTHSVEEAVFLADHVVVLSSRPGAVLANRVIPFQRPRTLSQLHEPSFQNVVGELERLLAEGWGQRAD